PPPPPPKSEVALREEDIQTFWEEQNIFNKSLKKEAPKGDYVFYDGPPFATGLPHYGHILAGTIKDAIPRFWTMNGYRVQRKWGWDCHGLPLENLIEKKLGLATKRDIEEYGVKNFNEAAREAVLEYRDDWKRIIPRLGRWADMENDYRTMDSSYTESVWWVFSELNKKGLVYEGFKSMHLCPRCGTTLSNFEVNQGYKDIKDIAVTVKLPLLDEKGEKTDTSLLVWTTTPWTLPGNFAAAVHKDERYAKAKIWTSDDHISGEEFVILAKERLTQLATEDYEIVEEFKGEKLVGRSYVPPFDFWQKKEVENKENAWKIYHADYVEIGTEGTGAVHLAPAYGEEDMNLAKEHNIPIAHHVDEEGKFMEFVEGFECRLVKPKDDDDANITHLDADIEIVRALAAKGALFKKENITHSYPHCWRCDTPLLNYATTSWFVRVTDIKDKLVAENNKVHWVPETVGKNRFGKWLEGARDWAVSRQRYWGAPLPIWRNPKTKEYKVFGSLAELTAHTKKSGNEYLLMRHGQAESNVKRVISAKLEANNPLTGEGEEQAKAIAKEFKGKVDVIVHSGFLRTKQTAEILRQELGLSEDVVFEETRFGEIQIAKDFDGRTWVDFNSNFSTWEERYTKSLEGNENYRELKNRVGEALYELDGKHKDKRILIVGHAGSLIATEYVAKGLSPKETEKLYQEHGELKNGQWRELDFVPLPHNDNYELDFHRPYIDDYEVFDEDGTKLERVKDVFDCWFESGSMPYGQHHYPFENKEQFEKEFFPANFIAEGLDQTRGWFYSLIVLGTALFNKSPFENVIVNGLVLAEDGRKMSKSLRNYPDPMELVDRVGSDAIRYYLLSAPIMRAEDLNFSEKEVTEQGRKNLGRLHNVLLMYEMYKEETQNSKLKTQNSSHVLDRWIIARLNELITESTYGFENYELDKATRPITDFIDDLSVWYLRRSRDRLKGEDEADKKLSLITLRFVLQQLSLLMAPSMPFYADYLWGRVKADNDVESVHLAAWPKAT
ncbi:MAG: class I tRNA ligase family protein, partial [Candidatus Paceibacterota bacterium]